MKVRLLQGVLWCQRLWRSMRLLRVALVFVLLGAMTSVAVAWAIAWHGRETFGRLSDARRNSSRFEDWVKERPDSWVRSRWVKDWDHGPRPLREGAEAELVWVANVDMIDRVGFPLHAMSVETRVVQGQRESRRPGFSGGVIFVQQSSTSANSYGAAIPFKFEPILMSINVLSWGGVWWLVFVAIKSLWRTNFAGLGLLRRVIGSAKSLRSVQVVKRVAVFVALGFTLSVCVAWWCSWAVQIPATQAPSAPRPAKLGEVSAECERWHLPDNPTDLRVQESSTWGRRELLVTDESDRKQSEVRPVPIINSTRVYGYPDSFHSWRVIEFGFPFPSMRLEMPVAPLDVRFRMTDELGPIFGAIVAFNQRTWLIPLQFSVWPTVLNSVVFGTLVWLLWTGFTRVLSRFKPEPGMCLSCGYDASGLARCPECGGEMNAQPVADQAAVGSLAGRG